MDRSGIFAGEDPIAIARAWLAEATPREPNDANAMALATVDADGMPDVRMVLLKDIGESFVHKVARSDLAALAEGCNE